MVVAKRFCFQLLDFSKILRSCLRFGVGRIWSWLFFCTLVVLFQDAFSTLKDSCSRIGRCPSTNVKIGHGRGLTKETSRVIIFWALIVDQPHPADRFLFCWSFFFQTWIRQNESLSGKVRPISKSNKLPHGPC